ncbi:MAG TPA: SH3 domain-containing protein [Bryobacteraceae bacterium]|nr:SH3 domain-containing protein [Bryobacteraceae bacterium]
MSCGSETPRSRAIGEAYVGPAALPLRNELSTRSQIVATLKHGEKLEVLQTRRRFFKVRNMGGSEGWVDAKNLLSAQQMAAVQRTVSQANTLPSQGRAAVFEALNIHTEPNRQSPSPFQVAAGGSVDVVAHIVAPRVPYRSAVAEIVPPAPKLPPSKKSKRKVRKTKAEKEPPEDENAPVAPPPMPAPPKLPENWRELSKTDLEGDKPGRKDDWTLVRTSDKKAGWVLTRMLVMGIPDEVAQYAEGKRITSYFSLGEVTEEDGRKKNHWLWTTLAHPLQQHDFDGMRVFIYNVRRHRYETAYIEREIKGFYPVLTKTVEVTENRKTLTVPGFSITTEDKDGQRWKRTFAFQGNRVRLTQKEAVDKPGDRSDTPLISQAPPASHPLPEKSLWTRVRKLFNR